MDPMQEDASNVDAMSVESTCDLMDEFEESIKAFQIMEDIHTEILVKLHILSKDCSVCDVSTLKKMHQDAMNHIRATGSTNFGQMLSK
jgi:hypothetical protein